MDGTLILKVVSLANEKASRSDRIDQIDDEISRLRAEQDVCRVEIVEIDKELEKL